MSSSESTDHLDDSRVRSLWGGALLISYLDSKWSRSPQNQAVPAVPVSGGTTPTCIMMSRHPHVSPLHWALHVAAARAYDDSRELAERSVT